MTTPLDKLRAALVLRKQRAWDTARDGPEPRQPPLTVPIIVGAAVVLVLLVVLGWWWFT